MRVPASAGPSHAGSTSAVTTTSSCARDAGRAKELAGEYPGAGTLVADLANPDRMSWALGKQSLPEQVDSLLHIAGVVDLSPVAELRPPTWQQAAQHQPGRACRTDPATPCRNSVSTRGQVIFVNSGSGLNAHAEWAAYAASKHGLKALADALRLEEHGNGVRVTSVYPGRTATPMQAKVHAQEGKEYTRRV